MFRVKSSYYAEYKNLFILLRGHYKYQKFIYFILIKPLKTFIFKSTTIKEVVNNLR